MPARQSGTGINVHRPIHKSPPGIQHKPVHTPDLSIFFTKKTHCRISLKQNKQQHKNTTRSHKFQVGNPEKPAHMNGTTNHYGRERPFRITRQALTHFQKGSYTPQTSPFHIPGEPLRQERLYQLKMQECELQSQGTDIQGFIQVHHNQRTHSRHFINCIQSRHGARLVKKFYHSQHTTTQPYPAISTILMRQQKTFDKLLC